MALAQLGADAPGVGEDHDSDDQSGERALRRAEDDDEPTRPLPRFQGAVGIDGLRIVNQCQRDAEEVRSDLRVEGTLKVRLGIEATPDSR